MQIWLGCAPAGAGSVTHERHLRYIAGMEKTARRNLCARDNGSRARIELSAARRMLVCEDGTTVGSLSAGCLESDVAECAREVLRTGQSVVVSFDTRRRFGCAGKIDIFIERVGDDFLPSLRKTIKPGVSTSQLRALKERSWFRRFLRHFAC